MRMERATQANGAMCLHGQVVSMRTGPCVSVDTSCTRGLGARLFNFFTCEQFIYAGFHTDTSIPRSHGYSRVQHPRLDI
jgi:hypothetical protein